MNFIIRRSPTRALARVEPFYHPMSLMEDVESMARQLWESWSPLAGRANFVMPAVDMYEEKDELVVKAELPGMKKADLDISLEGDMLTIKAEKKQDTVAEDATYYTSERHFGEYSRSMLLSSHVNAEQVAATFKNGLLEIRLPKAEEAKPKHIDVKIR